MSSITLTPNEVGLCIAKLRWGPGGTAKAVEKFLDTAIAIATAESGLNPRAVSSTDDWGLFQINQHYHKEYFSEPFGIFNPVYNTGAAKAIYHQAGDSWSPWSTYKSGSYRAHLGSGASVYRYLKSLDQASFDDAITALLAKTEIPVNEIKGSANVDSWGDILKNPSLWDDAIGGTVENIPDAIEKLTPDIPGAIKELTDKLIQGAKVAGFFLLAALILIMGIMFLLKDTTAVKRATSLLSPTNKAKIATKVLAD